MASLGNIKRIHVGIIPFKFLRMYYKKVKTKENMIKCIEEDLKTNRVSKWWENMFVRDDWSGYVREAKTHSGLDDHITSSSHSILVGWFLLLRF